MKAPAAWLLAACLAARAAHAQDDDVATSFARAVELLQGERHLEALGLLERVRAQRETAAVAYNMAIAQRALGRHLEAIASLRRYLELAGARIDDARRAEIEGRIDELRGTLATVTVRIATPPGDVTVTLDGEPFAPPRWNVAAPMNPGRHVFVVRGARYHPLELVRAINAGGRAEVELRPEPVDIVTRLRVTASARDAEVLLDGLLVGSDGYDARVAPGHHRMQVRAPGFHPYESSLDITPGASLQVRAQLVEDIPITRRWWFWTGVGALVAGAVTAVVWVAASGTEAPACGSTGWCPP